MSLSYLVSYAEFISLENHIQTLGIPPCNRKSNDRVRLPIIIMPIIVAKNKVHLISIGANASCLLLGASLMERSSMVGFAICNHEAAKIFSSSFRMHTKYEALQKVSRKKSHRQLQLFLTRKLFASKSLGNYRPRSRGSSNMHIQC